MSLPFGSAEFADVFGAFNAALWPAVLALWLISAGVLIAAFRAREPSHRSLVVLLAFHWSWSALAYHAAYFTRINPAAWLFAGLFLIQGVLFARCAVVPGLLRFSTTRSRWRALAVSLTVFSLVYPIVNLVLGLRFPRMATFGVPCPTTLLTLGLLLIAEPPSWVLAAIPIAWALVGGSAALLLGVQADLMLFVAAALVAGRLATRAISNRRSAAAASARAQI